MSGKEGIVVSCTDHHSSDTPRGNSDPANLADFLLADPLVRDQDAVALVYESRSWTWRQWSDRIARLAGALTGLGVGPGDRVGFLDKNHPACLEIVLAAASLGAAVAVLNWRQTDDEIAHVLSDSGVRTLFVGTEFRDQIDRLVVGDTLMDAIVTVGGSEDSYEALIAGTAPTHTTRIDLAAAALVIYSSGTTGRPKGVVLSQRALIAHTVNVAPTLEFSDGDMNLVAMPLFHVGGICYALMGIHAGVPTIMTRDPRPEELVAAIDMGATHAFLVPPVIAGFLNGGQRGIDAISRLRRLVYGAAPTPQPLLIQALTTWPELDLLQVYGQTELAGVAAVLTPADHRDKCRPDLLLSVGKPVAGCEIRIVDPDSGIGRGPGGGRGEILVRTAQRMTGYLNQPEATAEAVTADGWVRTGDVGRLEPDGYLSVDDRLKDMIITGGENVYGPEVERVLLEHPEITDAAVIGVPHEHWGEVVKALVIAKSRLSADEIISYCRIYLASYKCPKMIDFVETLPRNASGKILKRQLRADIARQPRPCQTTEVL